ncbi:M20 family metallopeptidase [Staphylococcus shinii]|uniref:M20 family metallopeptidase n=1 Tax=Staphylococcus shinii TaxID=2912228 RepID=UPI001AAE243C|nr:M20 family metallopeptidase [Staphylococcus shinii]MBO3066544.1 amidohydrolase [Staphylococcus shinii]
MTTKQQTFVYNILKNKENYLNKVSEYIWYHPETRFEEYKSSKKLIDTLTEEGFKVKKNIANIETAFEGKYGEGKPVIGFLGEFDALSGLSQKPLTSKKEGLEENNDNGHGCGHNLLGVGSLGAAIATKEYLKENNLPGTVIYYGCPGEEGGSGKTFMSREGVFDDVDYAFCWHPSPVNAVMSNKTLANYQVYFKFHGVSSHAANSPELGRSALDAVELMNVGVNYIREHMSDNSRIHYAVTNTGGISPNVVQSEAEVLYLIRSESLKETKELFERVKKVAHGAALMTETEHEVIIDKACSDYSPNRELEQVMYEFLKKEQKNIQFTDKETNFAKKIWGSLSDGEKDNALKSLGSFGVINDKEKLNNKYLSDIVNDYTLTEQPMLGSSDVADVSWVAPTAQVTCSTSAIGTQLHTWQMVSQGLSDYAFKGMHRAARVMANSAIYVLKNPETLEKIKEEHKMKLEDHPYENPIPKRVKPSKLNG